MMPVITLGCIFCFLVSEQALLILGGEKYVVAVPVFRWMIPILFFSFPEQIYGWPTLGAVGKVKETTMSTVIASIAQILGLVFLIVIDQLNPISMAIVRFSTEALMMVIRMTFTYANCKNFVEVK